MKWIRPPQQARSRQTLERILDAAEAIISEKGVDNVSISEVTDRAQSSIGALYARFTDREGLLRSVFERFFERLVATGAEVFDPEGWRGTRFPELVRSTLLLTLRIFNEHLGLIKGYAIYSVKNPELSGLNERLGHVVADHAYRLMVHRQERLAHPQPERAVHFAVTMIFSSLEGRAVHGSELVKDLPEETVADELTRMCLAYLGWSGANGGG